MLNKRQFLNYIIIPTLDKVGLNSLSAQVLLLGTALVESNLTYLKQIGNGPALGLYQMEPATYKDIYENYLRYKPVHFRSKISKIRGGRKPKAELLIYNLAYATTMARVHYLRVRAALPEYNDAINMARYHKKYYNTVLGKTDIRESIHEFASAIKIIN